MAKIYSSRNLALANETGLLTQKIDQNINIGIISYLSHFQQGREISIHLLLTHFLVLPAQSVGKSKGVSFQSNCGATSVG